MQNTGMKLEYVIITSKANKNIVQAFRKKRIILLSPNYIVTEEEDFDVSKYKGIVLVYKELIEDDLDTLKEYLNPNTKSNVVNKISIQPEPIGPAYGNKCQDESHFTMIYNCIEKYDLVKNYDKHPAFILNPSEILSDANGDLIRKMLQDKVQFIMGLENSHVEELNKIVDNLERLLSEVEIFIDRFNEIIHDDVKFVALPVDVHFSILNAFQKKNIIPIFSKTNVKFGDNLETTEFNGLVFADIGENSAKLMRELERKFDLVTEDLVNFKTCVTPANVRRAPQTVVSEEEKNSNLHLKLNRSITMSSSILRLNINRITLMDDSFGQISNISDELLKASKFNVEFQGENGMDSGGLTRDWYSSIVRDILNPDYALFRAVETDRSAFQPNESSFINPSHLLIFKFIGRIIAKAIIDKIPLACHFSRIFYKQLLGKPLKMYDLQDADKELYNSLIWMEDNEISGVVEDSTFTVDIERLGERLQIDLKPNGANIPVTEANKNEFIHLWTQYKLLTAIKPQIDAFMAGFNGIIPLEWISGFTVPELERLISGKNEIDVDDWERHSTYSLYTVRDNQIIWFWLAVRSFDQETCRKLLKFTTGSPSIPLEGFRRLRNRNEICLFKIARWYGPIDRLPRARTCFNTINLPAYETYEILRDKLLLAINDGAEGFAYS